MSASSAFSKEDQQFMQLALDLAKQGIYTTSPNPRVGCVLVKNGKIVGKGFHAKAGEGHAEVMALKDAGENAKGATAYVTLEPCSHYGRTPPCALGLINAGVTRVIAAMQDPNPQVAGRGLKILADAGIETQVGLLSEQAEHLNRPFLMRMRQNRPFVQLKMAISLDGRTAMASGESKWISNEQSRADVQKLRAASCAILSTSATVLHDNPRLNVRYEQFPDDLKAQYPHEKLRQPIRIILDNHHKVRPTARLFECDAPVWLVSSTPRDLAAFPENCEQIIVPNHDFIDLPALLHILAERQINALWLEAGATLAGAFIENKLVDELIVYLAPKILGDQARGFCKLPHLTRLADASNWECKQIETFGSDVKLTYYPKG